MSDFDYEPNEEIQSDPAPRPSRQTLQRPVRQPAEEGNWFTRNWKTLLGILFAIVLLVICGGLFWLLANNTIVKPMNEMQATNAALSATNEAFQAGFNATQAPLDAENAQSAQETQVAFYLTPIPQGQGGGAETTPTGEGNISIAIYVPAGCLYYLETRYEEVNAMVYHGLGNGTSRALAQQLMTDNSISGTPIRGCTQQAHSTVAESIYTESVYLDQGMNWGNFNSEFVIFIHPSVQVATLPTAVPQMAAQTLGTATAPMSVICESDHPQANLIVRPNEEWIVPACMEGLTVSIHWSIDTGTEMAYAVTVQTKRRADFGAAHDGGTPFYLQGRASTGENRDWETGTYTLSTGQVITSGTNATLITYGIDSWPETETP